MPHIIGMSVHEALGILSLFPLNTRVLGYKHDVDVAPGTIMSQIPLAGTMVKPHQSVSPAMPQCIQKRLQDTMRACETVGITPTIHYLAHSYPRDICFAQSPEAGTPVRQHSKPIIYVSSGATHLVIWPNLIGYTVEEAISLLSQKGITAHIVSADYDESKKTKAYISEQRPLAGSLIDISKPETVAVHLRVTYSK
jgi:beta-lactam-binding protein with PASTA domain